MNNEKTLFHKSDSVVALSPSGLAGVSLLIILIYILLLLGHVGLVWFLPYFPSQDGPSHLYNLAILHDLIAGSVSWGDFFDYKIQCIPNWGFHIFAYPLLKYFSPLAAEKIFLSIFMILMSIAVPYFLVTFSARVFPLSFLIFPVIFNFNLMMGFYSYAVAVPLLLLGIAINWKVKDRPLIYKFIILNIAGLIIYLFHFIAFCLFLIAVFLTPLAGCNKIKHLTRDLIRIFATILPSVVLFLSYLLMSLKSELMNIPRYYSCRYFLELVTELPTFSIFTFSHWQAVPYAFLLFVYLWLVRERAKEKMIRKTFSAAEKYILYFIVTLTLIYLVMPFNFGSGSYFNQRFPWVIFLISLPMLRIPAAGLLCRYQVPILILLGTIFLVVNSFVLYQESCRVNRYLSGLSFNLPKRSYVMSYIPKVPRQQKVNALLHAVSHYCLAHQCVDVGNYEVRLQYFPVSFKDTVPAFPMEKQIAYAPRTIPFRDYPAIDYLICFDIEEMDVNNISRYFQMVWHNDTLSIWHRLDKYLTNTNRNSAFER